MRKNSFKDLEQLEMENVTMRREHIQNGITSDIGIMKYIGYMADHFFPKIFQMILGLAGGPGDTSSYTNKKNRYPDLN